MRAAVGALLIAHYFPRNRQLYAAGLTITAHGISTGVGCVVGRCVVLAEHLKVVLPVAVKVAQCISLCCSG